MERRKEPKTWHGGRRGREVGGILAGVYFRKVMREGGGRVRFQPLYSALNQNLIQIIKFDYVV